MTVKEKKEILGDCYLEINHKNKKIKNERIFRAIDEFINRPLPNCASFYCDNELGCNVNNNFIRKYLSEHPDIKLINSMYFIDYYYRDIILRKDYVLCEKDNRKHILIYLPDGVKLLDDEYECMTNSYLRDIYTRVVFNIIDIKYRCRKCKELINELYKLETLTLYEEDEKFGCVHTFKITIVNRRDLIFSIYRHTTRVNLLTLKTNKVGKRLYLYGLSELEGLIDKYNKYDVVNRDNVYDYIKKSLDKKAKKISSLKNSVNSLKL